MSGFKDWWNGTASPARRMPVTVADQVEWVAKAAFAAGEARERSQWEAKEKRETIPDAFTS